MIGIGERRGSAAAERWFAVGARRMWSNEAKPGDKPAAAAAAGAGGAEGEANAAGGWSRVDSGYTGTVCANSLKPPLTLKPYGSVPETLRGGTKL